MTQEKKFDYNQLIGFILMGLLFGGYMIYSANQAEKEAKLHPKKNIENVQKTLQNVKLTTPKLVQNDSIKPLLQKDISVSNDKLNIIFSAQGAQLKKAEIKTYKAYSKSAKDHKKPLLLIDNNAAFDVTFTTNSGKTYHTKELLFASNIQQKDSAQIITFSASIEQGNVSFIYTLHSDYQIDFDIVSNGLNLKSEPKLDWNLKMHQLEKSRSQEMMFTDFHYAYNKYDDNSYINSSELNEAVDTLNWICAKQQFFLSILESKKGFSNSIGKVTALEENRNAENDFLKAIDFSANLSSKKEFNENFTWYFLPMNLDLLNTYKDKNFDSLVPFDYLHSGFIGWINKHFFYNIYKWLRNWGISAGIVILLMTIIMKLILFPIMFKQHKQSAMMRVLRPELDELNAKYKDKDPLAKQNATMELYRKAGVNPLSGCIPALIQVPLFMALFRLFPNIIQMRGESFLWADDLTSYDSVYSWSTQIWGLSNIYGNHISLFALLYCVVLIIYTKMTAGNNQMPQQEGMPDMSKIMYIMPVMFVFWLNSYSSGLSWYYVVSNLINILMILFIKKYMIDETKIHQTIQDNKKKPAKKKGKFAQLIEQAAEQQRAQQQRLNKK